MNNHPIPPFRRSHVAVTVSQVWRARLCALLFLLIGLAFQSPLLPCSRALDLLQTNWGVRKMVVSKNG